MVSLLAKWLIKAKPDADDPQVRHAYGMLCSICGIALNLLLVLGKLIAGTLTGSIAITADAMNNLSDIGSSLIALIGFKMARQRPDQEHPFGHGRMEYIAGLLVAAVILLMGVELLRSSVGKIITPEPVMAGVFPVIFLLISIGVKAYMALYNQRIGKAIDSAVMRGTALDSLSDVVATLVVLLTMVIGSVTGLLLDGWGGLLVSLFILYSGVTALRDTVDLLLGRPPKPEYIEEIKAIVRAHAEVLGVHDLVVHDYGPGRRVITLHAEVPAGGDMLLLHDTIDNIEKELQQKLGSSALIHMDPIVTEDALTERTHRRVAEAVRGVDERVTIHDFRMVSGPTHTNLIFDASVPFDVKLSDKEIKRRVAQMVHALDDTFFAVVTVDRVAPGME